MKDQQNAKLKARRKKMLSEVIDGKSHPRLVEKYVYALNNFALAADNRCSSRIFRIKINNLMFNEAKKYDW